VTQVPRDVLSTTVRARSTVRGKLMRVVLLTTAIAVSVTGLATLVRELFVYQAAWVADLSTEAAILALSTGPALAFDDHALAQRNLDALQARRRVMVAALYSPNGRVYASFVRPGEAPPPLPHPPEGVRSSGDRVEFVQRVQRNGEVLGTIYLRAQYDITRRVEAYIGIFVLGSLLSMVIAYFLSKKLQKGITEPLDAIAAVARDIVSRRDYSLRATKTSDDEIGVVVDAFNKMLEEVQTRSLALADADRRKDEFLATLAHELRNPLAPIRHAVKLLESKSAQEQQHQWARDVISRQVQRMALLLDDLLDVSRITRGRLDLKVEAVDLESLVGTAVETVRPLIEARQHQLSVALPSQRVILMADPLRLSQSLSNLLTNAAKYTDAHGQITLVISLLPDEVIMSVKDTGIGFEPGALPGMFEMFSQVDSAIDRAEGGLGIGLALVKGLIELHGGTIQGFSAGLGLGSEFTIHLPMTLVIQGAAEPAIEPPNAQLATDTRFKVVVADDNRDAADSLALLLDIGGYHVFVGHSGEEALAIARQRLPDAMILDIGMPDVTGYEVARRIREEPWGKGVLLIAVTGWGQKEDKALAAAAGFDHHLTKPVDPDHVERLLQAFFTDARARP
jgi:signal transduction histidine kinase/ActR/RegA family two-component response regulator